MAPKKKTGAGNDKKKNSSSQKNDKDLKCEIISQFDKMLKYHPSKYHKYLDEIQSKLSKQISFTGKPNVLINEFQIENGKFVTKTLSKYSVD